LEKIRIRLHGFIYALLTVTYTKLKSIDIDGVDSEINKTQHGVKLRQAKLASAFRDRMSEGQSFQGPNAFRNEFYNNVMQAADEVRLLVFSSFGEDG
jgi:hypothetical protein